MEAPQHPHFKVIAHRGNSSQAPENTLAAFRDAISLNVDYIECDVQLSKDLVPVVMHDSTIHRILAKFEVSEVNELNWEDLKTLDAGSWFDKKFHDQRIMSLKEFLSLPKANVGSMIEIKKDTFREDWMARIAGDIMKVRSRHIIGQGPLIVGSLSPDINIWLQDHLPELDFIAIVEEMEDFEIFLKKTRSHYFGLRYNLVTKDLVDFLRSQGKEVWAWTVDDKDTAKKLVDDGVQGIITNQPKKMQSMHLAVVDND
jgi:glycerophosphoryl diester phosphodiesterase